MNRPRHVNLALKDEEGNWIFENNKALSLLADHLKNIYRVNERINTETLLDLGNYTPEDNRFAKLDDPISPLEVQQAVFSIGPRKAPGPDGLHAMFFQKS